MTFEWSLSLEIGNKDNLYTIINQCLKLSLMNILFVHLPEKSKKTNECF